MEPSLLKQFEHRLPGLEHARVQHYGPASLGQALHWPQVRDMVLADSTGVGFSREIAREAWRRPLNPQAGGVVASL